MHQRGLHQQWHVRRFGVDEGFQIAKPRRHQVRGGGTNNAVPGLVPPIRFWLRRNSPGSFSSPRPLASRTARISLISRSERGNCRAARAAPERYCSHMRDEVPIITAKALPMLTIEVEQEIDGRWIAEVLALPGVMVYGATETEARSRAAALACRVIADRIEHGEPIPDEARDLFTLA